MRFVVNLFPIILSKWYKNGYIIHYYFIQRGDTRSDEPHRMIRYSQQPIQRSCIEIKKKSIGHVVVSFESKKPRYIRTEQAVGCLHQPAISLSPSVFIWGSKSGYLFKLLNEKLFCRGGIRSIRVKQCECGWEIYLEAYLVMDPQYINTIMAKQQNSVMIPSKCNCVQNIPMHFCVL